MNGDSVSERLTKLLQQPAMSLTVREQQNN